MNVFEHKPVNEAHMLERKAKKCMQVNDYETASTFYQQASCCLSIAMEDKYSMNCYEILRLQYDRYSGLILKCKKLLDEKPETATEIKFQERTNNCESLRLVQVDSCQDQDDHLHPVEINYALVPQREPDTLLQFLNPIPTACNKSQKLPKTKDDIIEELQTANKELKLEVTRLLKQQERLESENSQLHFEKKQLELQLKLNEEESLTTNQNTLPQTFRFDESHFNSCNKFQS